MNPDSTQKPIAVNDPTPVLAPGYTYGSVTDKISAIVLTRKTSKGWIAGFALAFVLAMGLLLGVTWAVARGVGIWGINIPIGWGFAIINFVWWIGIGHAGTLISAILLLLHQEWRTSINRFAEAMTLFAVACAGLFPLLHTGRQWLFYWMLPIPNTMGMWPQFRSPLLWDVFAVSTYGTVSLLFWYVGLVPDLATLRDRAKNALGQKIYGVLALGWRGSAAHWHRYETAYLLLAGLATPLVVSVHTVVSFDFAVGIVPGWHTTIFPPYFVAGAIYSGFAMVMTLAIPIRKIYGLEGFITMRHLQNMAKVMLATGLIVGYGYLIEIIHSLVQRQSHRAVHGAESLPRPLRAFLLGADLVQHRDPAADVEREDPRQCDSPLGDFDCGQHRDVAGAVCHRGGQPAPRFSPFVLEDVLPDELGLPDVCRDNRAVPGATVPVHSLPACYLHFRDESFGAKSGRKNKDLNCELRIADCGLMIGKLGSEDGFTIRLPQIDFVSHLRCSINRGNARV